MLEIARESGGMIVERLPAFAMPCVRTLVLSVLVFAVSAACGLAAAAARRSTIPLIRWPADFYVWFIRGTPTLIQVYLVYFSLPTVGIILSPEVAGVLALGLSSGAYMCEIFRAGLQAVPKGQYESSVVMGMAPLRAFRRIIFPQAFRIVLPAMTNEAIATLKSSSLLSLITVYEITLHTKAVIAETFAPLEFYLVSTVLYLILADAVARLSRFAERQYAWGL